MTAQEAIGRALSATARGCKYKLGAGGRRWWIKARLGDTPWNPLTMECDCSGFVAWTLGEDRLLANNPWYRALNGGWLETSAIVRDCESPYGLFDRIEWQLARMGDLLVWGDKPGREGHVGVVTAFAPTGPVKVVHCSMGNFRGGDAIRETPVKLFVDNGAIVARYAGFA